MEMSDIKEILRDERNTALKLIDYDFYDSANQYIREIESELKKIENPRSIEYKMLEDEFQSALDDIEVIFTRRIRKIITHAVSTAFSNNPSSQIESKLLLAEQKVFSSVLNAIQSSRNELIEPILNPSFKLDDDKKEIVKENNIHKILPSQENDSNSKITQVSNDACKNIINKECIVIRILKDIPTFKGIDGRNYSLSANDIISLPMPHAKGLIKRNVAQHILEEG